MRSGSRSDGTGGELIARVGAGRVWKIIVSWAPRSAGQHRRHGEAERVE